MSLQDPQGNFVRPKILDNGDGTYVVTYTPADVGRYTITVKYGGQNVPGAPFSVQTSSTGDAGKVRILGKCDFVIFSVPLQELTCRNAICVTALHIKLIKEY